MIGDKQSIIILFLGLPVLWMLATGCDDRTIDPFEENVGLYSVYGAIAVNENPNYIRISDLSSPFPKDSTQMEGVTVTFENLATGAISTLRDSIVDFSGNFTHNFIVREELDHATPYRLAIENSEGSYVSSIATTPGLTEIELTIFFDEPDAIMMDLPEEEERCVIHTDSINDPDMSDPNLCPKQVVPCTEEILFAFGNVRDPERIQLEVGFEYNNQLHWDRVGKVKSLNFNENQDEIFVEMTTRQLLVEVFPPPSLGEPRVDPRFLSPLVECHELDNNRVHMRYIHFGPEWGTPGARDIRPINPIESVDIEGGMGFFGAYRMDSFSYFIDDEE